MAKAEEIDSSGNGNNFKLPLDGKIQFLSQANLSKLLMSRQNIVEALSKTREKIRPWNLFFSTTRFKSPQTLHPQRISARIVKNVEHFQSNYLFIFLGLFIYCLITSPLLLLTVLSSFFICYFIYTKQQKSKIVIFKNELTIVQLISLVNLLYTVPMLYLLGAGAVLFWVLGVSCFVILLHALFYDIHSLLNEEMTSFLDGTTDGQGFELTMEEVV